MKLISLLLILVCQNRLFSHAIPYGTASPLTTLEEATAPYTTYYERCTPDPDDPGVSLCGVMTVTITPSHVSPQPEVTSPPEPSMEEHTTVYHSCWPNGMDHGPREDCGMVTSVVTEPATAAQETPTAITTPIELPTVATDVQYGSAGQTAPSMDPPSPTAPSCQANSNGMAGRAEPASCSAASGGNLYDPTTKEPAKGDVKQKLHDCFAMAPILGFVMVHPKAIPPMIEIMTPAGGDNFASEVRVKFEDTSAVVRFDEMKDGMSAVKPGGPWWPGALEHAVLYAQNLTPLQVCDPKLGGYVFESMRALFGHDGASYDVRATVANKAEVLQALKSCESRVVIWCTSPEEPGITLPRGLVENHCWAVSAYKEFIGGTVQLEDPNGGQVTVTNVDAIFTCTDTEASVFIDYEKDPNAPPPLPIASPSATQCDPSSSSESTTSSPTSTPSSTPTTNPENGNEGAQKAVEAAAAAAAGTGPGVVAAIETATAGLSGLALLVALYLLDIARKASDGGGSGQDVYDAVQKAVSVEEAKGGTAVPGDVVTVTLNGSEVPVTITSESAAQVTMSGDGALVPATGDGALVPVATPSTNDTL